MKYPPFTFVCLLALGLAPGCSNRVTTEDVGDQQQTIEELAEDIQQLESNKEERAAEAAKEERADIEETIEEKRAELASEQQELAALKERKAFEDDMQAKLTSLEARIDQLEEEADEAEGSREVELRKQIAGLETRRDQMQEKLNELRAASGDAWANLKTSVEGAWESAEASMREAVHEVTPPTGDSNNATKTEPDSTVPPATVTDGE